MPKKSWKLQLDNCVATQLCVLLLVIFYRIFAESITNKSDFITPQTMRYTLVGGGFFYCNVKNI